MNDKTLLDFDDIPDWAWAMAERYDLIPRSDSPYTGGDVLVQDAAFDLKELTERIAREGGLTTETLRVVTACAAMVTDALKLASISPEQLGTDVVGGASG